MRNCSVKAYSCAHTQRLCAPRQPLVVAGLKTHVSDYIESQMNIPKQA